MLYCFESREEVLESFYRIAKVWELTNKEQEILLGARCELEFYRWKKFPDYLPTVNIKRIQTLVIVYNLIERIFIDYPQDNPNNSLWVRKQNNSPLFNGKTVIEYLLNNPYEGLSNVKSYLEEHLFY